MKRLFLLPLAVAVVCSFGFAQDTASGEKRPAPRISQTKAQSVALERVRADLGAGQLAAWGGGQGGGIRPADVTASRTLFNPTGGKNGSPIYVVLAGASKAKGQVRVIVDATSGAVLSSTHRIFEGATPDWWVKGLDAPPAR